MRCSSAVAPLAALLAALVLGAGVASAATWVGSWASAQQTPEPQNALAPEDLAGATLRQVVHLSIGGQAVRVRFSNAFGTQPLHLAGARLATPLSPASAAIEPGSDRALTFDGRSDVTIPAGADWWSDPVATPVKPGADLTVSISFDSPPFGETGHPGSRATSYLVRGDHLGDADLPGARKVEHWYFLSGVDVQGPARASVVVLGDSITDGHGATTNGNDRWPDDVARRLQAANRDEGVLNLGIGGNHILTDGLGPNAVARFDRDVLSQSGARTLVLLEGINDLGMLSRDAPGAPAAAHAALLQRLFAADAQLIARAREHGLRVVAATLTPYGGSDYYHPGPANEADRKALNAWIRTPGRFDAVIDFDAALRDPAHPDLMRPVYDSGDHLHPSPAGYRAMADAVALETLAR